MNTRICIIVMVFAALSGILLADGMIIIYQPRPVPVHLHHPVLPSRYIPLSVKYHRVNVAIEKNIAVTRIDQEFYNPNDAELEGMYIFPLPDDAAISSFSLYINGVETKGEVLDKDKARKIYEDIVRRMKDPALLEYVGRKMFKARVYPIPAHGTRRIKLEYSQSLQADAGLFSYTYPLNTEKFSSEPLQEVMVSVMLKTDKPLKNIYCPTHKAEVKREGDKKARIVYEASNVLPDKDLTVYYSMEKGDFGLTLATFKKDSEHGYFMAMISPSLKETGKHFPKDVAFVFDTSGSMSGEKIKQARNALTFCLNSLRKGDRFSIIDFSTEARCFKKGLTEVNEHSLKEARSYIHDLEARGGTNISEALQVALQMRINSKRPFFIVFMTDGKPTLGIQNEEELIKAVRKYNTAKARIFVFGVGYNVNTLILDRIAEDSRGARAYVSPEEDIEIKISSFFTKIENPVLTDVKVSFENIDVYDLYPKTMPDLFSGSQIEIFGRYKSEGERAVILSGVSNGKDKKYVYEENFSGNSPAGEHIAKLWAVRKIYYLLDSIRLHGMNSELKSEIVRLSKEFGILTPYTSYLVLEDNARIAHIPGRRSVDNVIRERLRDEVFAAPEMVRKEMEYAADALEGRMYSGKGAISASKQLAKRKKDSVYDDKATIFRGSGMRRLIKTVAEKTFYFDGEVWIDSKYDGQKKTSRITFMSDDYFEFLKRNPEAGKFMALGKRVIFRFRGMFHEITE